MSNDFSKFLTVLRPQVYKSKGSSGVFNIPHVDRQIVRAHEVFRIRTYSQTVDAKRVAIFVLLNDFALAQHIGELLFRKNQLVVHNL